MAGSTQLMLVLMPGGLLGGGAAVEGPAFRRSLAIKRLPSRPVPTVQPLIVVCRENKQAPQAPQVILPNGLPAQTGVPAANTRVVNCVVQSNLPVPACVYLACNPVPPGPCSPQGAGTSSPSCSWNLKPNCSSPYPLQPNQRWQFGFMTADRAPFQVGLLGGKGFRNLQKGQYKC